MCGFGNVVHVVEWECIFEMDVVGVVVVVEVNCKDNMELGMEDIEENTEDIVDGFGVEMANVAKKRMCSNYLEVDMHNLEIVN